MRKRSLNLDVAGRLARWVRDLLLECLARRAIGPALRISRSESPFPPWVAFAALVLAACHQPVGDGTPGATTHDAGRTDAGRTQAGDPDLSLSVTANPNSVLTAIAVVHWSAPLTDLSVTVTGPDGTLTTPAQEVADAGALTIPLLPLAASTTYLVRAVGVDPAGVTWTSNAVSFATSPLPSDFPAFDVSDGGSPSPGYTLAAVIPMVGSTTPEYLAIVNAAGAPVWYYLSNPPLSDDFQQQDDGTFTVAQTDLFLQIDALGNTLHVWRDVDLPDAGGPVAITGTNPHDLRLQPNGDGLLFAWVEETVDLTSFGGSPHASVVADMLERVTTDGGVTFTWDAFDHIPLNQIDPVGTSLTGPEVDFTHGNAIDVLTDGSYLLSFRNLSRVYDVDSSTGAILWTLGRDGDFAFENDPLGGFSLQHGARGLPNGDIILFDDGGGHSPPQSRAAEYALDMTTMKATLVWSSEDMPPLFTEVMGYAQRLSDGNTLITYGMTLKIQEVDPSGSKVLWQMSDPNPDFAFYRAYRLDTISPLALTGGN